jgi:hypothetical protein
MLRVSGRVVRVDERSGSKADQSTGEIRPWSMRIVRVLVAEQDIVEVATFGSDGPVPTVGEAVDLAVEASVFKGKLSLALRNTWDAVQPLAAKPVRAVTG